MRSSATRKKENRERTIFGVPERFMKPRIIFVAVAAVLTCFGFVMIYSASSITAMTSASTNYDATYYLKRQVFAAAIGTVAALIIARFDFHRWAKDWIKPLWVIILGLLLIVYTPFAGHDAYGASRWVSIGGFTLQPAELAKIVIVLAAANIAERYYDERSISFMDFIRELGIVVVIPLALIFFQPDKGSTIIIAVTLLVMAYLAGMDHRWLRGIVIVGIVGVLVVSLAQDYSRERIMTMLDPWKDPLGSGYQLIQGFYAFGSGGLFGVGVGMSRQKYSYLPMAYNDFIFAVIGEELGLVGTISVLAAFGLLAWAGYRIARYAPDMCGRLVAAGCTSLIIIQLLVNVCGVLGMIPLSGKPVPFISYGGSTIMSCLMLVGMVVSVSRSSSLPETVHDRSRRSWRMTDDASPGSPTLREDSYVGTPTPRSARRNGSTQLVNGYGSTSGNDYGSQRDNGYGDEDGGRSGFRVVDGGAERPSSTRQSRRGGRADTGGRRGSASRRDSSGSYGERIDLGPSPAERLRGGRSGRSGGSGRSDRRDR